MVQTYGHIASPLKRALEALQRGETAVLQVKKQKPVTPNEQHVKVDANVPSDDAVTVHVSVVLHDDIDHVDEALGDECIDTDTDLVTVYLAVALATTNDQPTAPFFDLTNTTAVSRRLLRAELQERRANALQQVLYDTHSIHTYPKQQEAFDACEVYNATVQDVKQHLVVWAEELPYSSGKRKYLTATYSNFYHYYSHLQPQHRHFYELIRHGAPCHLYFDIEYKLAYNLHITAEQSQHMVDVFIDCLISILYTKYGIELQRSDIVVLDSSSDVKFSCHLICHFDNGHTVFRNNVQTGHFVHELCQHIRDGASRGDQRMQSLYINTDATGLKQELFVDEGVYTRNRCMRLYLSSKAAPQRTTGHATKLQPLKRAAMCQYKHAATDKDYFFASLASYVEKAPQRMLECDGPMASDNASRRIVLSNTTGLPHAPQSCQASDSFQRLHEWVKTYISGWGSRSGSIKSVMLVGGHTQSSCAQDQHAIAAGGRVTATASQQQPTAFSYTVVGDRFCTNINRQHRSNGIYFVVSLLKQTIVQRCYDHDCRQHTSQPVPVPGDVIIQDVIADDDDGFDWLALEV